MRHCLARHHRFALTEIVGEATPILTPLVAAQNAA
jgi:hypothetical protein